MYKFNEVGSTTLVTYVEDDDEWLATQTLKYRRKENFDDEWEVKILTFHATAESVQQALVEVTLTSTEYLHSINFNVFDDD
jgi:hypothetical protein